jgi:hypothetical protein
MHPVTQARSKASTNRLSDKQIRECRAALKKDLHDKLHGSTEQWWSLMRPVIERKCAHHMFQISQPVTEPHRFDVIMWGAGKMLGIF